MEKVSFTWSHQYSLSNFSRNSLCIEKSHFSSFTERYSTENANMWAKSDFARHWTETTDLFNKGHWKAISWEQLFVTTKQGAELNQWPRSERLCNLITNLLSYAVHPPFIFTDKRESYYLSNFCSLLAMQKLSFSALKGNSHGHAY